MTSRTTPPLLGLLLLTTLCGCDLLFGAEPEPDQVLLAPVDGLDDAELRLFLAGKELFETHFSPERGLGPLYDEAACSRCHPGAGRGHPSTNVTRFGRLVDGSGDGASLDPLLELGGPQLQTHAISGYAPETLPAGVVSSWRAAPPLAGVGLLEAVPAATLAALADPLDGDGDGISGRLAMVEVDPATASACDCDGCSLVGEGCRRAARFGRKAASASIADQIGYDLHEGMGVTHTRDGAYGPPPSDDRVSDPELREDELVSLVVFARALRAPVRRSADDARVRRGEALFSAIGCDACHLEALPTGPSDIEALGQTTIHPYTDLLLHDMGPALADGYPEGDARGGEWRTPALWGLGLVPTLLGGDEYYLHDGRARSLPEAIDLHGGEGLAAADAYRALGSGDRVALLAFLRSL